MKLEILRPLHIRRASGDLHFKAGSVADLPDEDALLLLAKKPDAVRLVEPSGTVIEPAVRWDGSPLRGIYWERGDTSISGPATPLLFEQVGNDCVLVVEYQDEWFSINANALRSKQAFESQVKPRVIELVRDRK